MKHLLLGLPLGLLAAPALGQQIEYSLRGGTTFASYHGSSSVASTNARDANNVPTAESSRATNPYGQNAGVGGSLGLRVTRQEKFKVLTAFDLSYELLQTRANITSVYYNSVTGTYLNKSSSGIAHLYTQAATAFAGVGYRLGGGGKAVALDGLVGPELAFLTAATERSSSTNADGTTYSSDLSRTPTNRLDFRLRGELTLWVKKLGVVGSYSYGFTNHMPSSSAYPNPDAELTVLRAGLAYRFK